MSFKRKLVPLRIAGKVSLINEVAESGKRKNEFLKQFNVLPSIHSTIPQNKDIILVQW